MAYLETWKNKKKTLNFTLGTILVLKPVPKASTTFNQLDVLDLFNNVGDILLHISFSSTRITLNDRARRSLGDGWGETQVVDLYDWKGRSSNRVPVSIYHYFADSEIERYQFLLDGITMYHFDKHCPGPATEIVYRYLDDSP
jgi:hypothetical protein